MSRSFSREDDPFGNCFRHLTPTKTATFSGRARPCSVENAFGKDADSNKCEFEESCTGLKASLLQKILSLTYTESLKTTLTEHTASIAVRSEQQFHRRDAERLTQRRHFYRVDTGSDNPGFDFERFGISCGELAEGDRLGSYVGFIDVRRHYAPNGSPLAMGFLAPPLSLQDDQLAKLILGDYSPLFGGPSFLSTVYSMQDKSPNIGAKCAQACTLMALGFLADRGADVKGSFTISFLSAVLRSTTLAEACDLLVSSWGETTKRYQVESKIDDLLDEALEGVRLDPTDSPVTAFSPEGLSAIDVRNVMLLCRVNAVQVSIEPGTGSIHAESGLSVSDTMAFRIFEAYIAARFPVVLSIDAHAWTHASDDSGDTGLGVAHSVVIVGIRKSADGDKCSRLIVHDPGWKPFGERSVERALYAARRFGVLRDDGSKSIDPLNQVTFVAATTKDILKHPMECVRYLLGRKSESHWTHSCLLGVFKGRDYRIDFMRRGAVVGRYFPYLTSINRRSLEALLPQSDFWSVVCRDAGGNEVAWFFDARSCREEPLCGVRRMDKKSHVVVFYERR